jgi:hypothetical protein
VVTDPTSRPGITDIVCGLDRVVCERYDIGLIEEARACFASPDNTQKIIDYIIHFVPSDSVENLARHKSHRH